MAVENRMTSLIGKTQKIFAEFSMMRITTGYKLETKGTSPTVSMRLR